MNQDNKRRLSAILAVFAATLTVSAQQSVDEIPFHRLFSVEVKSYGGEKYLEILPEKLKGDMQRGPMLTALADYNAYIYENYTQMHRYQRELLALLPDEAALRNRFNELMDADSALQRIYMRTLRREKVAPLPMDSAMRIAAHFFYVHRMDGRPTMHVCIGINKVQDMSASPSHPYHAAFCYMAIWGMKEKMKLFSKIVEPYRAEMKANPSDERLQEIERLVYDAMAREPALRRAVLKEYAKKSKYLPFELIGR